VVAQRALLDLAALAGAVCGLVFLACLATGSRAAIVISGSMEPSYPVGSLTFSRRVPARSLHIGDVVTVPRNDGNGLVTHRVVDVADGDGKPAFVLKGDANQHPDPLPYDIDEAGLVVACLPLVGYAVSWTQSHLFTTLALLAVVTFCALFPARALCAPDARSPTGGPARRAASSSTPPPGQPPPGGRHGAAPPASAPHSPRASRW
jgi:signal peptidase